MDSRQRRGVRCFTCNQFGHYARSCPWETQCGLCFGWGHRQDQCANNHVFNGPTNCQSLPTASTVSPTSSYSLNFNRCLNKGWVEGHPRVFSVGLAPYSCSQPLIKCVLGGVDVHALIDTGSMRSFVSKHISDKMRPLPGISNSISSCISITCEPLKIEGTIHTQLSFPCSGSAPFSGTF